ncbi:actin-related protein 2-like protein isoform X2 [Tanacetum coccineum]
MLKDVVVLAVMALMEDLTVEEVLFDPNLMDLEGVDGLPVAIIDIVKKIDPMPMEQLLYNIVLSGGSTSFGNLPTRTSF